MNLPPDVEELAQGPRWLLGVGAVAVLGFGVVTVVSQPEMTAAMPMRLAIASMCIGLLLGSHRSEWLARHLRHLCVALVLFAYVFFGYRAASVSMAWSHTVSLLLIAGLSVTLFRRVWEMVAFLLVLIGVSVWIYLPIDEPVVPLIAYVPSMVTLVATMSAFTLSKVRLEDQLRAARDELEERVRARTAELRVEVAERRAAEADALRASRAKSTFLTNMSHELRTPLNAIIGYTELVKDELAEIERPDLDDDLDKVRRSADHLLRMLNDVLDLSRIEAGSLDVTNDWVDFSDLLEELVRLVEPDRARGNVAIVVDVAPGSGVVSDRLRLSQILVNLLLNALKFTHEGTVTLRVRAVDHTLVVDVEDTGIGIRPEDLDTIFQRFKQVDESSTRQRDGSGLGLSLARELAQRLGGTLTVRSSLGEGSTFSLRMPREDRLRREHSAAHPVQ